MSITYEYIMINIYWFLFVKYISLPTKNTWQSKKRKLENISMKMLLENIIDMADVLGKEDVTRNYKLVAWI